MKESYLSTLLQMRLLVGFLGERAQFGWWPTSFHEASSRLFLEPVFSKTSKLAQYHGVLEAARRIHDEHLSVGSYHLFRMPEEIEQDLHSLVLSPLGEEIAGKLPQKKDEALEAIKHLCQSDMKVSIKDIDSPDALRAIAGAYASAFSRNARAYPYLVG
jgi:hypothetical protein